MKSHELYLLFVFALMFGCLMKWPAHAIGVIWGAAGMVGVYLAGVFWNDWRLK